MIEDYYIGLKAKFNNRYYIIVDVDNFWGDIVINIKPDINSNFSIGILVSNIEVENAIQQKWEIFACNDKK